MSPRENPQIEILRVLCITAMMWVHVNPGIGTPTVVSTGEFHLLGAVLADTLGRISVALLSFISGYLLWHSAAGKSLAAVAVQRFQSIIIPMLVWSAIFILLATLRGIVTGNGATALARLGPGWGSALNAWTGLGGPTANLSLFFLRDLFISTLLLRAMLPAIRRAPLAMAVCVSLLASFEVMDPIVFRPSILQFLTLGAICARMNLTLTRLSQMHIALPIGYAATIAAYAAATGDRFAPLRHLHIDMFLNRVGIGFLALAVSAALLQLWPRTPLIRLGRHSYLAYLLHVPLIGILWVGWTRLVGDGSDPSYVVFFLTAPVLAFLVARQLGRLLDRSPPLVQRALRGKIRRTGSATLSD